MHIPADQHATKARRPAALAKQCQRCISWLCGVLLLLTTAHCYIDLKPPPRCQDASATGGCLPDASAPEQGLELIKSAVCGNGTCEPAEEHCGNCPQDCACPAQQTCQQNTCRDAPICGDGLCNGSEDCDSCPGDCPCAADQSCRQGQCLAQCVCAPGQQQCSGQTIQRCRQDCLAWEDVKTCTPAELCDPTTFTCTCKSTCDASQNRCIGPQEVEECVQSNGCSALTIRNCSWDEKCVGGVCCQCTPKDRRCNGKTYDQECGSDCQWQKKQSCRGRSAFGLCFGDDKSGKCI